MKRAESRRAETRLATQSHRQHAIPGRDLPAVDHLAGLHDISKPVQRRGRADVGRHRVGHIAGPVAIGGRREVVGLNRLVEGALDDPEIRRQALERSRAFTRARQ